MIFYFDYSTDPAFNMAVEEVLLREAGDAPLFLLWQNSPAVIVGRHQNVPEEVNLLFAEEHAIRIIRRLTGGGAVYHDGGNLNYTFILPETDHSSKDSPLPDFEIWTKPVLRRLRKLGVTCEFSGRNDLTVHGKKFSGNAQVRMGKHLLHHGTLLFDSDFQIMAGVLNTDPEKFYSKGVTSVRSRVANLSDFLPAGFSMTRFKEEIIEEIAASFPLVRSEFTPKQLADIEELKKNKYDTFLWNYGKSPKSNMKVAQRFPWGKVQFDLLLNQGKIAEAEITGDFFPSSSPHLLAEKLIGLDYSLSSIEENISEKEILSVFPSFSKGEFIKLLFH